MECERVRLLPLDDEHSQHDVTSAMTLSDGQCTLDERVCVKQKEREGRGLYVRSEGKGVSEGEVLAKEEAYATVKYARNSMELDDTVCDFCLRDW